MKQIIYKLLFIPAVLAIALVITFAPDSASAQGFVPCSGSECNFCHFVELGNTVITWLIGILSLVFGVMVFIAGFGLVTSGGNDSKLTDAKKSLTNALIGLVIVLAAWLIVDTLIKLTLPEGETAIGPWNEISCEGGQKAGSARANRNLSITNSNPGGYGTRFCYSPTNSPWQICVTHTETEIPGQTCETTEVFTQDMPNLASLTGGYMCSEIITIPPSGVMQANIYSAASAARGMSTANAPNTNNGQLACAWVVNEVLKRSGLAPIDSESVVSMKAALDGGRGTSVTQSQAKAGDLVLITTSGGNHVGICMNTGCSSVLSNSSSRASLSWNSGPTFAPSYTNATPVFYRVNN